MSCVNDCSTRDRSPSVHNLKAASPMHIKGNCNTLCGRGEMLEPENDLSLNTHNVGKGGK